MSRFRKEKNNPQVGGGRCRKYVIILSIVAFALLALNVFEFLRGGENEKNETAQQDKFSLLNPARNFFKQEDLIINFQPLRDELDKIEEENKNVSIYFEYLPTGANIAVNKDAEFWPASLLKIPVSMAAAKKIENSQWKWENELVLMPSDKNDRFGDLYKQPIGTRFTIETLVKSALMESDNTANFILVRNLDPGEFQDIYDHIGFSELLSVEGKISAKKYSTMFRALYNSSYLSEENSQKLLSWMAETKFKEYLGSVLPENVKFSHKIGISDDKEVFLDSGIVYLQYRPYILTVMINTKDADFAKSRMKEVSEKVYNYVISYNESKE